MKRFNHLSIRSKLALGALVALTALAVPVAVHASFGPSRPTKVYNGPGTPGFDHVTFDSFTNVPGIGDERNFFNGAYPGNNVNSDPMPQVKDGDVLTLQVYVHNDADPSLNTVPDGQGGYKGVAKNTKVRVVLPTTISKKQEATAYISADNATPGTVYDTLDMSAANGGFFQLEYVKGSAKIHGNYINTSLPDSVVTTGATIGTNALDGNLKGCFQQEVAVTIQVKVKMPEYSINKEVRMKGQTSNDWAKTDNVKAGDDTQWLITFKNNGETPLKSVNVVDQVPAGMTVVPGSVKLINGNFPNGYTYPANAVQDNGRTINVAIGDYNPGILAYVMYDTTIDKPAANVCSPTTLTNKAFATPQGFGAIFETASVTVAGNKCAQTASCDLFHVTTGDNRTVTVDQFKQTTSGGATLNDVTVDWGDKTTALQADATSVLNKTHQYAQDGNYTITATAHFTVNGQQENVSGDKCVQTVSFTQTPPTHLPNTGPGAVAGIFAAVTVLGAFAHRLFLSRRLSLDS